MSPEEFIANHRTKVAKGMAKLRADRKAAKRCIGCGGPRDGYLRCKGCRSKIARHRQASRKTA